MVLVDLPNFIELIIKVDCSLLGLIVVLITKVNLVLRRLVNGIVVLRRLVKMSFPTSHLIARSESIVSALRESLDC